MNSYIHIYLKQDISFLEDGSSLPVKLTYFGLKVVFEKTAILGGFKCGFKSANWLIAQIEAYIIENE